MFVVIYGDFLPTSYSVNPIQDGPFWDCSQMEEVEANPLPKICDIYPTMMKLGIIIFYL